MRPVSSTRANLPQGGPDAGPLPAHRLRAVEGPLTKGGPGRGGGGRSRREVRGRGPSFSVCVHAPPPTSGDTQTAVTSVLSVLLGGMAGRACCQQT